MDLGILLLRLVLSGLLAGHAAQKLFGWFRGQGALATASSFEAWGLRPGILFVVVSSSAEFAGAAMIAFGAVLPLATAIVVGAMTVAVAFNLPRGLWAHLGGFEVALVYGLLAIILSVTGPGRWSIDSIIGTGWLSGPLWAAAAVVLGVVGGGGTLVLRARELRIRSRQTAA